MKGEGILLDEGGEVGGGGAAEVDGGRGCFAGRLYWLGPRCCRILMRLFHWFFLDILIDFWGALGFGDGFNKR